MENRKIHLYETEHRDFELIPEEEEAIMKAMRNLNKLWKQYLRTGNNRLILFCGSNGCDMRMDSHSYKDTIQNFEHIRGDGGDGGDEI